MNVRLLRNAKNPRVGQVELCRKAGVSRFRLSNAENGRIQLTDDELSRIASALDVPVSAIFQSSGESALTIDIVMAGDYTAAICGPRQLPDGTIQEAQTIELDDVGIKCLSSKAGQMTLRKRLERVYDCLSQAPGAASEPATWSN